MKKFLLLFFLCCFGKLSHAGDTIIINEDQYFIDSTHHLILTNIDTSYVNSEWTNSKTQVLLNETYTFSKPVTTIKIGTPYEVIRNTNNEVFILYFTELPIISIDTNETIVDEPDVLATFKMIEKNQDYTESYVGIKYRGSWSQTLPKKSLKIEFWEDSTGTETKKVSLLDLRKDDDWMLQAMYNEPLRIRSKTNNDLWRLIDTLAYQNDETKAINGIRMRYTEVFINNEYRGVYCLGEKVDKKQLKLKKHNGSIRGELYKGIDWGQACTFSSVPDFDNDLDIWSGFEYKHPKEEIDWTNLYNFIDFVVNSDDDDFFTHYKERFEIDNLIDNFIFLNLLRATDNFGKNNYVAKYTTDSKYFYVPWDLDGTYGINWHGKKEEITNDLLTNGFYDRVLEDCATDGFIEKLKEKWTNLRASTITHDNIMNMLLQNHTTLVNNGVYEREQMVWDYTYDSNQIEYISNWLAERLNFLDNTFNQPCDAFVEQTVQKKLICTVYPNPTKDVVCISTKNRTKLDISLFDSSGKLLLQTEDCPSPKVISVEHLENGLYFLHIRNEHQEETVEILISK